MRESGILQPIFSLPSKFGIGCFSKEAYEFIDFLVESGQGFWQILPLGPTGYGDSPYQPFSAFAGNPYFVSPEVLIEKGYLTWDEANSYDFGQDETRVDYGALYNNRFKLLKTAYERFVEKKENETKEYKAFLDKEEFWLRDYCLFRAIKEKYDGKSWLLWDDELRLRDESALKKMEKELSETVEFYKFIQYEFQREWDKLHEYAKKKNIKIIGDIPFYVSLDGSDAWSHKEAFLMDKDGFPTVVAGCPPDAFSSTGQLWGNPIYDWKNSKRNGYDWWMRRMERSYELVDVVRVDHFHGFAEYYAVPYGDENALKGKMEKGPGMDFFNVLYDRFGDLTKGLIKLEPDKTSDTDKEESGEKAIKEDGFRIIAEDLGTVTKENQKLLEDSRIPGMKVLQYAFTSWDSYYITHRHISNCVVYTGTHDNTTSRAWIEEIGDGDRDFVRRYINSMNTDFGGFVWDFIREAYRSVSDLCIIPLQDYLVFGKEARINYPGRSEDNWQWRLKPNFLSHELASSIKRLAETYGRIPRGDVQK